MYVNSSASEKSSALWIPHVNTGLLLVGWKRGSSGVGFVGVVVGIEFEGLLVAGVKCPLADPGLLEVLLVGALYYVRAVEGGVGAALVQIPSFLGRQL